MVLIKLQPSRKKRKEGDVFIIQPKEDVFFFGVVVKAKMALKDPIMNGGHLIFIFNYPSREKEIPENLFSYDLLIAPQIVNNQGWLKGYFETLGTISINKKDIEKNYGFWDIITKQYVDEMGEPLPSEPNMFSDYGLGSYGSVSVAIKETLDKSPELLRNVR